MNEEKDLQELLAEKVKAEFDAWAGDALYIDDEEPAESFTEIFPIFREKWQNFKV